MCVCENRAIYKDNKKDLLEKAFASAKTIEAYFITGKLDMNLVDFTRKKFEGYCGGRKHQMNNR